jgi:hypothetical protein
MKRIIVAALVAGLATPAVARCPYGQILRVSMGKCVGWHSKLAAGYVHPPRHKRIVVALPAARPAPIEPPEIEVLRERLTRHALTLEPADILLSRAAALVEER